MEKKQITNEEVLGKIEHSYDQLEDQRATSLEETRLMRDVKAKAQTKERERLRKKYGDNHPKVKRIDTRINYNQNFRKEIDIQIDHARTKLDPISPNGWRVHGRVFKADGLSPVNDLTISLFDEAGQWVRELGYDCTNEKGFYSITYEPEKGRGESKGTLNEEVITDKGNEKSDKALFLTVTDEEREIIHQEKEALFFAPGQIEYREIILSEKACEPPVDEEVGPREVPPGKTTEETSDFPLILGKMTGEGRTGQWSGLTIQLVSARASALEILDEVSSDDAGNFDFSYAVEEAEKLVADHPAVILMVTNEEGKIVYRSKKPFKLHARTTRKVTLEVNL